jgi:hypothetical protein
MTTLRMLPTKFLLGFILIILCKPVLGAQQAPQAQQTQQATLATPAPQAPQATAPQGATETRTGCLTAGSSAGTFVFVQDMTGQQMSITGPGLSTLKSDQKVTATGVVARRGTVDIFEATKIDPIDAPCQVGFSADALKRSIGRARFGGRAGLGLDPELIVLGAQAEFGPVFGNIWVRPSAEFAFGEVTKIFNINLDGVYYLPFIGYGADQARWATYVGAGPTFTIERRDFEGFPDQPVEDVDSDWSTDFGLNIFVGITHKNGMFFELKAAPYSTPAVRLYVGYSFK